MQHGTARALARRGDFAAPVAGVWAAFLWALVACSSQLQPPAPEPAGALTYFAFEPSDNPPLSAAAVGLIDAQSVLVALPAGTALGALVPRIEHTGVRVEPAAGVAQDFSGPVRYVVTAGDGSSQTYTVVVNVAASSAVPPLAVSDAGASGPPDARDSEKVITLFSIAGVPATIYRGSIALSVPFDTHLVHITPKIEYRGAAIEPRESEPQDFRQPVVYEVIARDGSSRKYTVHVSLAPNDSKSITHFRVFGIDATIEADRISLTLPAGTDVTQLSPSITLSGGTVSPESDVAQDFTQPVVYTVSAADGTTQRYTVVVSLAQGSSNDIESFQITGVVSSLRGDEIVLQVPYGTSSCSWAPDIVHTGASIQPASGEPQDFREPVVYTVRAADGSERRYTAQCHAAPTSARGITEFTVLGYRASVVGDDITLTLPNTTSLTALAPEITHAGVRVSPASGVAQNFLLPVTYRVLEYDGTQHSYTVTVALADAADNELVELELSGYHAQISGDSASLTLPAGSDARALAPRLLSRGLRVVPISGTQRDFSMPVTYSVVARDGSRRDYSVSVSVAGAADKQLVRFELLGAAATISGQELSVRLPYGVDLRALTPSRLEHTGVSVLPAADAPQDFTQPVQYVISARDGSTQTYSVRASLAEPGAAELLGLRVLGRWAEITADSAELTLPTGTDLRGLVPELLISGHSLSPKSALPTDFTQPVVYDLSAADGTRQRYTVLVHTTP